ncbi:hypothetical protein [Maribacter sp. 2304DJ31-5]|uniref:hypothetical protein n=1 Tax=Maribacter sp. 2304DJ31-5 TaxID=3386273 RepID=UPI0039BC4AAA
MKLKGAILYLLIAVLAITSFVLYKQKNDIVDKVKKEASPLLEQDNRSQSIREKEIMFQAKSFFPEKWILNDYNYKNIDGVDVFSDETLLVLFILPESCSPCLEKELKELDTFASMNKGLKDRIVVITSYEESNEFKAFSNSHKLKNIRLYNRFENSEQWATGAACYFIWKNGQVSNIYIPRMENGELNLKFRQTVLSLIEQYMVLYIINEEEVLKPKSYIHDLDSQRIESISVLDSENGEKEYGHKGKNGVYIIKLSE